ncbi:uncharacterized protein N7511_007975 [Penicillium nucicola]|uniref:uncharacterized protein n=1 Tax=Penicillium nucicola TaxID=1850975 RepID=UPI002544DF1B|nr:uncharacterized protein N7511_007975 [Penicillium nucicola]KAJ5753822.1 hypothetical protein N7511_007975 [Penicillium nucicola]
MPRIPFSLILKAQRESQLLSLLLKECRTIDSARNELRWLRERAIRDSWSLSRSKTRWKSRLRSMCQLRSKGYPLQYILGDQPFGDLEILCKKGVLIPRPETESYTYQAAKLVRQMALDSIDKPRSGSHARPLRIIDLCTGTGCIPLLLHALLAPHFQTMSITGIDISPIALNLAQTNLKHNLQLGKLTSRASTDIQFHRGNVLGSSSDDPIPSIDSLFLPYNLKSSSSPADQTADCDLLISNPPYISQHEFGNGTTARSVRLFEPKMALVPPSSVTEGAGRPEDIFYHRILALAFKLRAKITVFECGDLDQAKRVIALHETLASRESGQYRAEVWPSSEGDLAENGFHATDGSRGVIIQRLS